MTDLLRENLLFDVLWDRVLDDPARRMLYRMTLLRLPWNWDLMNQLGDPAAPPSATAATVKRLGRTSLLEAVDLAIQVGEGQYGTIRHFTLHPATAGFIAHRHGDDKTLRLATHRRLGDYLEAQAKATPYIETFIEAGHHLFQAGEYDRSYELLGPASNWLLGRGRVREGLLILEPCLVTSVLSAMQLMKHGPLLGTVGLAYAMLGQVEKAVGYHEQALVIARDRRPPGRGGRSRQLGPRLRRLGSDGEGHRLSRAGPGHRPRDRRPAGRGGRPRQPG